VENWGVQPRFKGAVVRHVHQGEVASADPDGEKLPRAKQRRCKKSFIGLYARSIDEEEPEQEEQATARDSTDV